MRRNSILYYGYSHSTYTDCMEQISSTNRKHALMTDLWFVINNLLYVIFSLLGVFGVGKGDTLFYSAFLCLSVAYGWRFCS